MVTSGGHGRYTVHADDGPVGFTQLADAVAHGRDRLAAALVVDMAAAGAPVFETHEQWHQQTVDIDGLEMFVEGHLALTASGRPQLARS